MAFVAAYAKKVEISPDGSAYTAAPATHASLSNAGTVLDDTNMSNNAGYKQRMLGLRDWSVTLTVVYDASDAAISALRDAWMNRTAIYMKYLPNGTNGFSGQGVVEHFNMSGDVDQLETVEITIQANSALATV